MISLLVAFVLYEGNANWYWWAIYALLILIEVVGMYINITDQLRNDE